MTPEQLSAAIRAALQSAVDAGDLSVTVPAEVRVERPRNRDHGDWSTNVALQLAKGAGIPPRDLATALAEHLADVAGVQAVDVAGPGFLNITLEASSAGELARSIVLAGDTYGHSTAESGRVVNLEFISANPTGPIHIGHTRWAALGDAMRRLLSRGRRRGHRRVLHQRRRQPRWTSSAPRCWPGPRARSLRRTATRAPTSPTARPRCSRSARTCSTLDPAEALEVARDLGYIAQLAAIRTPSTSSGCTSTSGSPSAACTTGRAVEQAVDRLREQGHVFDGEGAVWLRTTDFGDDKDRVLIRGDGSPTYFAADAAYYLSKKDRGFDEKVYLLGADHHGYINRLKAIAACAGDDPEHNIEVKIGQLISIAGARMGKRLGNAIYIDELIEWIGKDAVRYSLARYPADSPLSLDGEELRKQSNDNPVFYVQYAHARTANVARLAAEDGVDRADGFDASLLSDPTEAALLAVLGDFPRVVAQAAHLLEPHRVARYLEELAGRFHKWYDTCRVRPVSVDEEVTDLHRTRLWLNDATRVVLANGLDLLGVSAPERM